MLLLGGRCSNTKWNWNHDRAHFSESLLELAGKLGVLAPAQPSLHEGRGTFWVDPSSFLFSIPSQALKGDTLLN